jgi:hypothetical protein
MFERLAASEKEKEKVALVDMNDGLAKLGLQHLPEQCKPCGVATDKLASSASKLAKSKKVPFVNVKLSAFLPPEARDNLGPESDDEESKSETFKVMQRVMGVKKEPRTLSFLQCLEALQRYAIAGALCKQFRYSSGLAHVAIVTRVAARAAKEGKRHATAVAYDQRVRERWAVRAYNAGLNGHFDLDEAMCTIDEKLLEGLLREPVKQSAIREAQPSPHLHAAHEQEFFGECHYCHKHGHRKIDCYAFKAMQKRQISEASEQSPRDEQPQKRLRPPWPQRSGA